MQKRFLVSAVFVFLISILQAQIVSDLHADTWKGFKRVNFTIDGYHAYYVVPAAPLAGRPWLWRTSFPDWHTAMDSLLLVKGMYIVYLSIDNQYGSPAAMQEYDKLYDYLTGSLHFAFKCAMEGVSRGGLYEYTWAKRNPDKVTALYAEAPVCDIKSWPGGKLKSPGDSALWKQLLQVYGFTEQQAMAYDDNPIDHLEGLAAFKVPLYHIVGYNDKLAPSAENTTVLLQRYTALGGPAYIYPVTAGPQELQGHHFPIEHPDVWAGMILQNCFPVKEPLHYDRYISVRGGIDNAYNAMAKKKQATVAFLGGSITYNPGWRNMVCRYLRERFPATRFHFIAAGIPSLGSLPHAFRVQQDVLDSGKIDLLFVEAAVNDRVNGTDSTTQVQALEGIIRHVKTVNPATDIILMGFADQDKNNDFSQSKVPAEIANQEMIADHYNLPSINLAREVYDKIQHKEFTWEDDFKDVHSSPFGQALYFATMKRLLTLCFNDSLRAAKEAALPVPLDKNNLAAGKYYNITNAKLNKGWQLVPDWTPTDGLDTREGFVHVPMLVGTTPGAALTLPFTGTAVGMAVISGRDAGIVEYSIDKKPFKKIDLYTQWSSFLHLPWYVLFGDGLKEGHHTLRLRISKEKNAAGAGNACRIVYFLVN
ncbi:MAG TPA: GDSL-type esterase/lipase family protein [Chitinophagaceae bacterium]|nr:GDSL-type esterase/lipase family protein [Chitinophagaceae bacterium]